MANSYPPDWAQLTPDQKREYRLNRFMNPTNIKFVGPEAEKAYKKRAQRYVDAFNVKEPDRCLLRGATIHNTRLEVVKDDFPKGSAIWWFDRTDMALAKKILGDKFAIMGNVPSSRMGTGSPADVKACCRKLIETCGKDGGYIMAAGCIADNPKLENLQAMMETVREYGVYR
jgi:hypothetical protein